jgi:hypothetical protein
MQREQGGTGVALLHVALFCQKYFKFAANLIALNCPV